MRRGHSKKNDAEERWRYGLEVKQAIDAIREGIGKEGAVCLASVEEALRSAALRSVAHFLGSFYSGELPGLVGLEAPEGSRGRRPVTVLSTVGEVTYSRAHVRNAEGRWCFPLDAALGIVAGCTSPMAALLSRAGATAPSYEEAGEFTTRASGVSVPGRRVHRVVEAVADAERKWTAERPRDATEADVLNVQADMTGLKVRKEDLVGVKGKDGKPPKKRQIKVGAVFLQEKDAKGEIVRKPFSTTRVVQFSDWPEFATALHAEAVKRGYLRAKKVAFTSDGADWIWDMATQRFPDAVQIVDFFHATEHLAALCESIYPKRGEAYEAMLATRRSMLRKWGVDSMIRYFEDFAAAHPEKKDAIESRLHYFRTHRKRMQYREFRKQGLFIGSGVIEGSCKCLVNQRCDLAGQRWHPASSQKVLTIRAAVQDGLHDRYWEERSTIKAVA